MLDLGFIHALKRIVGLVPKKRQTLFFSATMPKAIRQLADAYLHQPGRSRGHAGGDHRRAHCADRHLVNQAEKAALLTLLLKDNGVERALVFSRTKHGADKIVRQLAAAGITSARDPRQQVAAAARAGASPPSRPARCRSWSRPTSPRAASTFPASATSSTSTCRTCPSNMSTASAAPRAPAPRALRLPSARPTSAVNLRDIERLTRLTLDTKPLPDGFFAAAQELKALKLPTPERGERNHRGGGGSAASAATALAMVARRGRVPPIPGAPA